MIRSARTRQRGYTLIGMMVGLVISLLTIAAMLAVYRMVVEVSGQASADSQRDGQVASGLLAVQMQLHQAGYDGADTGANSVGLAELDALEDDVAVATSVIEEKAIKVDADDQRNLTWRYEALDAVSGLPVVLCSRLEIAPPAEDGAVTVYRFDPAECAGGIPDPGFWAGKTRQVVVAYARPWTDREGNAVAAAESGTHLDMGPDDGAGDPDAFSGFRLVNEANQRCTLPYAQQAKAEAITESPRLVLQKNGRELFSTCLSNIIAMRKAAPSPVASGSGT